MDRSRMYFCPDLATGLTTQAISKELAEKVFGDAGFAELLKARYDQMGHWFRDAHYNDPHWDLEAPFSDCTNKADCDKKDARLVVPKSRLVSAPQNVTRLFDYDNFGHDMPVWVSYNNDPNAKRIMIVSQDPLRSGDSAGNLYLSTPFGVHSCDFEKKGMHPQAKRVLNTFLDAGFCVYLTDYMKFFAVNKGFIRKSIKNNDKDGYERLFSGIIDAEIRLFEPILTIIIGRDACDNKLTSSKLAQYAPPSNEVVVQKNNDKFSVITSHHFNVRMKRTKSNPTPIRSYFDQIVIKTKEQLDVKI